MRAAILQLNASDDPSENLLQTLVMVRQAVTDGAEFVFTPEVTNCLSTSRSRQNDVLHHQVDDPTLAELCNLARELYISISIGSLALKTDDADGRFANRSFLINSLGDINPISLLIDQAHVILQEKSDGLSAEETLGVLKSNMKQLKSYSIPDGLVSEEDSVASDMSDIGQLTFGYEEEADP